MHKLKCIFCTKVSKWEENVLMRQRTETKDGLASAGKLLFRVPNNRPLKAMILIDPS